MNIRAVIFWAVVFCGLISCSHDERVPRGYIGMKEMGSILLDMQMADAYNNSYIPGAARQQGDREKRIKTFYLQVLMLHHTNKEDFLKSYHFYEQHPDLMKKIYGMMQSSINKKSAYADSVRERQERLRHPAGEGTKKKAQDFLFLYQPVFDRVFPKPARVFKPRDYRPVKGPQEPLKRLKKR